MGHVYARKQTRWLWVKYQDEHGQLCRKPTKFTHGEEAQARRWLAEYEDTIAAKWKALGGKSGPLTLRSYADSWLEARGKTDLAAVADDASRLRLHVLPTLGGMLLEDVRPRHLKQLFAEFRREPLKATGKPPAPKTVWNTYGALAALFRDAAVEGIIDSTPCILTEVELGEIEDADPEWRDSAHFKKDELEALISDPRVPADRQMMYVLQGVGGMRHGEAAALTWRHWQPREPLGELFIARGGKPKKDGKGRTKTRKPRYMAVHPTLAAMLAEWRLSGWPALMGRQPEPGDLICPTGEPKAGKGPRVAKGSKRSKNYSYARFCEDLDALGFRHRRQHDFRRTMISLAQDDGADKDKLYRLTHNPKGKGRMVERYSSLEWSTYCREVLKWRIGRPGPRGQVVALAAGAGAPPPPPVPSQAQAPRANLREGSGPAPEGDRPPL
jgi:integrase